MLSFFILAVLFGMSHALEADHVAAVSSMAARQTSVKSIMRTGAVWGLGHTLTLMAVAGGAIVVGATLSDGVASWLEFGVGIMLVGLGGQVIYRLVRERVHFHIHRHPAGQAHFHAHSHLNEPAKAHNPARHNHDHRPFPVRALVIGMMHGMAGSAALLVLSASSAPTPVMGFAYVIVFGLGSIVGMASLSAVIAVPLAWSAKVLTWANRSIQATTGLATVLLGAYTMYETQGRALLGG